MPLTEAQIRQMFCRQLARHDDSGDAARHTYADVMRTIFVAIVTARGDTEYWAAVEQVIQFKAVCCMEELSPSAVNMHVIFGAPGTDLLFQVLEYYQEALSYVHDRFTALPAGNRKLMLTRAVIARRLVRLDQEHQMFQRDAIANRYVSVPCSLLQEFWAWSDYLLELLMGSTAFREFVPECNRVLCILRGILAAAALRSTRAH